MTFYQYLKTKTDAELKEIAFSRIPDWFLRHLRLIDQKRKRQAFNILKKRKAL